MENKRIPVLCKANESRVLRQYKAAYNIIWTSTSTYSFIDESIQILLKRLLSVTYYNIMSTIAEGQEYKIYTF